MEYILYEANGAVGKITINREKALNALNSQVLDELNETLDAVNLDEVRCLILTGAGTKWAVIFVSVLRTQCLDSLRLVLASHRALAAHSGLRVLLALAWQSR